MAIEPPTTTEAEQILRSAVEGGLARYAREAPAIGLDQDLGNVRRLLPRPNRSDAA